jgi:hypothetical protein
MAEPTKNKHEELEPSRPSEVEDEGPEASEATEDEELEAPAPAGRARQERSASSGSVVRWLAAAALVVALGALGTSLWVLLRPPPTGSSAASATTATTAPSPQQIADAKAKVCGAYDTVGAAVTLRINANPGPDPAAPQAEVVAANTRLALAVGYSYLVSHLDPATPAPLAAAMRRFAENVHDVAIYALAGVNSDDPAQAGRLQDMVTQNTQILDLCK